MKKEEIEDAVSLNQLVDWGRLLEGMDVFCTKLMTKPAYARPLMRETPCFLTNDAKLCG